jgi:hypothetical protein
MERGRWVGFEAKPLDRLMTARHAGSITAVLAALSTGIVMLRGIEGPLTLKAFAHRGTIFVFWAPLFGIAGWWAAHAWNQLWRRGRSDRERMVYDYGVRGFGALGALGSILYGAWQGWQNDDGQLFGSLMIFGILAGLFLGTPFFLHFGHWWGTTMAKFMGLEADARNERGEPPHVA